MRVLKFINKKYGLLIGFILLGFALYLWATNGDTTLALLCFLSALCVWQREDIADLNKRVYDLEMKNCDLEIKLGKLKWGIKE